MKCMNRRRRANQEDYFKKGKLQMIYVKERRKPG
jgi:hypothetical protein